jgi:nitroreductase
MDIVEVVKTRRSIRAFKSTPVSKEILNEIMEGSIWAPSWGNTQPWDFYMATGDKLMEIQQGFIERIGQPSNMEIARPASFPEEYVKRRRVLPASPPKNNKEHAEVYRHYGAPCVIYICTSRAYYLQEKGTNAWAIFDCGMIAENIMLLAANKGLGTVAQAQAVAYPEVVRKALEIPDSLVIVLGIAIGYPDWEESVNQRRSTREPVSNIVRWYGFE